MKLEQIIKNKWHLHFSLTFLGALLLLWITDKYPNFMDIGNSGNFLQGFLTIFSAGAVAFCVEYYQGLKGYNRTAEQRKASNLDMLVSVLGATLATILYFVIK